MNDYIKIEPVDEEYIETIKTTMYEYKYIVRNLGDVYPEDVKIFKVLDIDFIKTIPTLIAEHEYYDRAKSEDVWPLDIVIYHNNIVYETKVEFSLQPYFKMTNFVEDIQI